VLIAKNSDSLAPGFRKERLPTFGGIWARAEQSDSARKAYSSRQAKPHAR
jgi:hypothetical protein